MAGKKPPQLLIKYAPNILLDKKEKLPQAFDLLTSALSASLGGGSLSVDEHYLFEALTRWNYFPNQKSKGEELPPVFSSRQFTPHVAKRLVAEALRGGGYDQV